MSEEDVLAKGATARGKRQVDLGSVARLWPTPCAQEDQKSPEAHMAMKARMVGGPRSTVTSLTVAAKLWPTPTAVHDTGGNPNTTGTHGTMLTDLAVRMWATPTAHDEKASGPSQHQRRSLMLVEQASSLPDLTTSEPGLKSSPATRRLNPRFVSWLMNVPVGWTCTTTRLEPTSYAHWEMASSLWLRHLLSRYSQKGRA